MQIAYNFERVTFEVADDPREPVVVLSGHATDDRMKRPFCLKLASLPGGGWTMRQLTWEPWSFPHLESAELAQEMVNLAGRLLLTLSMWPSDEEFDDGARLRVAYGAVPAADEPKVCVSFRSELLALKGTDWNSMWDLIEQRSRADEFFRVQGFAKSDVIAAVTRLRAIFPCDWVRAQFKQSGVQTPSLASELPRAWDAWFPASHLARTALGVTCVDPAWNYLLEIALAIDELAGFDGLQRLTSKLTKNPGNQHHLCLASELHRRGLLLGLEPPTGAGKATDDLLVGYEGREYAVEVKEFTSSAPAQTLRSEIAKKVKGMPKIPMRPVVFHAVLREQGQFEKDKDAAFADAVAGMSDELPPGISAVVAGRRFVDSAGGRVKRDVLKMVLNPRAVAPSRAEDLAALFGKNYSSVAYPLFGIGTFINIQQTPP